MSAVAEIVALVGLLGGLGAGALAWYHRNRARSAEERADAAETAVRALREVNGELRTAIERGLADKAQANKTETQNDASTAAGAAHDALAAARLLNGLHANGAGPGGGAGADVPPASAPEVPRAPR